MARKNERNEFHDAFISIPPEKFVMLLNMVTTFTKFGYMTAIEEMENKARENNKSENFKNGKQ